jgi:hypothetical protein
MKQRYWEPSDFRESDPMRDWVSDNVMEAIRQFINECFVVPDLEDGKITLRFQSFDSDDGVPWIKKFDLEKEILEWVKTDCMDKEDRENVALLLDNIAKQLRKTN